MMFLLRAAFWVSLVLILLPSGSKKQEAPQIKAADAASAASAAVSDLSSFCTRQPESCAVGSQVATVLGQRAEAGARMLFDFFTVRRDDSAIVGERGDGNEATGTVESKLAPGLLPRPRPMPSQDTLTASDRRAPWRTPKLRQEAELRHPI
jgi:hypothetical protein